MNMNILSFICEEKCDRNSVVRLTNLWKYRNTIPSVIDQREVQEIGGVCARHPFACLMKIIAEILEIENCTVLDLTYGVGEFYRLWRPKYIVAFDVKKWNWVVQPNEFYERPFWAAETILGEREYLMSWSLIHHTTLLQQKEYQKIDITMCMVRKTFMQCFMYFQELQRSTQENTLLQNSWMDKDIQYLIS